QIMETKEPTPQKTFDFACHCGAVKFQCELDHDLRQSGRCNCSSCSITRLWCHPVTNISSFKMLTPEENQSVYRYGTNYTGHYFCKTCGTQTYIKGDHPGFGTYSYVSINCLQGFTQEQFSAIPVHYANGAEDNHKDTPKFTSHL
ncbi:hypothetical protein SAMD00019534_052430, partial [Acytostelium subglobosum LB1]|uniref:hypothetical protein n=1 Tax=Acytostelium subglobosum LB1 TaxID=1410327 RepID=UPI0006447D1D